jgi:hypothetical protein
VANTRVGHPAAYKSTAYTYNGSISNDESGFDSPGEYLSLAALRKAEEQAGKDITFNMNSAILTSLYSSGMVSLPQPPYSCPSGNCTWPPFPTIAVSAQCFDHRSRIHLNCSNPHLEGWNGDNFTTCAMEFKNSSLRGPWEPSSRLCFESEMRQKYSLGSGPIDDFNYGYSYIPNPRRNLHLCP